MNDIKMLKELNTLSNDKRIVELLMDTKNAQGGDIETRSSLMADKERPQSIVERLFNDPSVEQAQTSHKSPKRSQSTMKRPLDDPSVEQAQTSHKISKLN